MVVVAVVVVQSFQVAYLKQVVKRVGSSFGSRRGCSCSSDQLQALLRPLHRPGSHSPCNCYFLLDNLAVDDFLDLLEGRVLHESAVDNAGNYDFDHENLD